MDGSQSNQRGQPHSSVATKSPAQGWNHSSKEETKAGNSWQPEDGSRE